MLQISISTFAIWQKNHSSGDKNQNRSIMSGKEIISSEKEIEFSRKTLIIFDSPKIIVSFHTEMLTTFATKVLKETSDFQENDNLTSPPFITSTNWRAFPSNNIPSLFNHGHVPYYLLESTPLNLDNTEDIEDGLGHMTDKPMKNGRKHVDSGFVHDMMDIT